MKTKTKAASTKRVVWASYNWFGESPQHSYANLWNGVNTITYEDLPKSNGKWPWKYCIHDDQGSMQLGGKSTSTVRFDSSGETLDHSFSLVPWPAYDLSRPPSVTPDLLDEALKSNLDQIDLNSSDAVLLYSGVIQAVPLLGSVFKFNSIMRGVKDHITKSLRKKPFTTVIHDLISADFIDRFVISPTLADIRKFQDACDYTLRVLDTARTRNSHDFALQSASSTTVDRWESSGRYNGMDGSSAMYAFKRVYDESVTVKAFSLLSVQYDMTAVDPIKVWAQRVGLTRPLDSVWDLVPFSFVVDYFTRAGDFISHLSDEMSSIDGLKGKICSIRDLWMTETSSTSITDYPGAMLWGPYVPSGATLMSITHDMTPARSRKLHFSRYRVANAWERCMQLMSRPEDYLSVNLDLSQTRKRTLAELVIQAKL